MATKQEIRKVLYSKLSSAVWQKAKNALVGQELISWATEVIYAIQQQKEAIENIFVSEQTDLQDVIRLSNANIPTVQLSDPNYLYYKQLTDFIWNKVHDEGPSLPYRFRLQQGNVSYYLADYASLGRANSEDSIDLVFYQGTPTLYYYEGTTPLDIDNSAYFKYLITKSSQSLSTTWGDLVHFSNYINLGQDVLVSSIQVWVVLSNKSEDGSTTGVNYPVLLSVLDSLEMSPDNLAYKIVITPSGEYTIVFGDGQWGKMITNFDSVYISFLRLTNQPFSLEGAVLTDAEDSSYTYNVKNSEDVYNNAYVYQTPAFNSVATARNDLQKKLALRQAMSTSSQIRGFVNSFHEVSDSLVVSSTDSTQGYLLNVCIAPSVKSYTNLNFLKPQLNLYSSMIYQFKLIIPTSSNFIPVTLKTGVDNNSVFSSFLRENYGVSNCQFDREVSVYELSQLVYDNFGVWFKDPTFSFGSNSDEKSYKQTSPKNGDYTKGFDIYYLTRVEK